MSFALQPNLTLKKYRLFYDKSLTEPTPYSFEGDYFAKARDRMERSFALIQPYVRDRCIVDLGASPFYLLYLAKAQGATRCHGIYFSNDQHPLRDSSEIFSSHGALEISHANIETDDLPFADSSVDILTACEILEHCEHFPTRFASELRRILRPGGRALITVPNVHSIGNILKLVFRRNIYMRYRSDPTGRHKHEYAASQLQDLMDYLGLETVRFGYFPSPTSDKFWLRPAYRAIAVAPGIRHYSPVLYILGRMPDPKMPTSLPAPPRSLYDDALSIES